MVFINYSHSQFLAALIIGLFFPLGFPQMALNNSKQAALQLVVEGSGRCEMGQGEAPITWFTRVQGEWYENDGI